jgi:hypothetical protein
MKSVLTLIRLAKDEHDLVVFEGLQYEKIWKYIFLI